VTTKSDPLRFIVSPHIVQDLGLNLYTDLPRVLVEFVANAYDADSPSVNVTYDKGKIDEARKALKAKWPKSTSAALEEAVLPEDLRITIEDRGHGMSRDDLQKRFLVAGRRRREEEATDEKLAMTSPGGRILMGRKGLGKLAGFGVAQLVQVVTKSAGEDHATRITLDYSELVKKRTTNDIAIPDEAVPALEFPLGKQGTIVVLSRLLYGPVQSRADTVATALAEHFMYVDTAQFAINLNGGPVPPFHRQLAFGYPNPELPLDELVTHSYVVEGTAHAFEYRIRFTGKKQALPAKERGVRVYCHRRLAAAPSLLDADTNMHGFRMTDYMDGVVQADFIDDQRTDYHATDRQSLRWDTPLLQPMHDFLSAEIKEACKACQAYRDKKADEDVKVDAFTKEQIESAGLSKKHTAVAWKIAAVLESASKQGAEDPEYRRHLPIVVKGLGHGQIMGAIAALAKESSPNLDRVVAEITALAADEIDAHLTYVKGRLDGIEALRRIVKDRDFSKKRNEKKLQQLFQAAPWLIDVTYFEYLTADQEEGTLYSELEKELQISKHTPKGFDPNAPEEVNPGAKNRRPDLAFLLGNIGLSRVVIVELKAPNTPLYGEHLRQLQGYMRRARQWFDERQKPVRIDGILIGSYAKLDSQAEDVEWLRDEVKKSGNKGEWQVFDLTDVLERTEAAHHELLRLKRRYDSD